MCQPAFKCITESQIVSVVCVRCSRYQNAFVSLHHSGLGKAAKGNHLRSTLQQISPCLHTGLVPAIGRERCCLWKETECSKMAMTSSLSPSSPQVSSLFSCLLFSEALSVIELCSWCQLCKSLCGFSVQFCSTHIAAGLLLAELRLASLK